MYRSTGDMSHSSSVDCGCRRLLATTCYSGPAFTSHAHRAPKRQALTDGLINPVLGATAEDRNGCLWRDVLLLLERWQAIAAHIDPAQRRAIELIEGQRGSLKAKDSGGDPNQKLASAQTSSLLSCPEVYAPRSTLHSSTAHTDSKGGSWSYRILC